MNQKFPHLFSPIKVGTQTYPNRIEIAPAGGIAFTRDGKLNREIMYPDVERRCRGGAAIFLFGETPVSTSAARGPEPCYNFRDLSEENKAPYAEVAAHVHELGCRVLLELCHVGRAKVDDVSPSLGPDDEVNEAGIPVRSMTEEDIAQCCRDFADASYFLKETGYDGVLVHAGHGWLFTQFLDPRTNHRTDAYGGSLENRSRITVEVLQAIREKCGPDFVIECRVSGSQHVEGGYSVEELCEYCRLIAPYCDMIHISAGMYRDPMRTWQVTTLYQPHCCNADIAAKVKQAVNIPVCVVGGINDPADAERLIAEGAVDMVALGRQMRADAQWPHKAENGQDDEIRRCLRCMRCFPGPFEEAMAELHGEFPDGCSINPASRHPDLETVTPAAVPKKVLVVGGGVSGLQAAVTAAERGHQVTLIEQKDTVGGILNYAADDKDKADLYGFARTMEHTARNRGVKILLNTPFREALLQETAPEEVIIAAGSSPLLPPIPGLNAPSVVQAMDAYRPDTPIGQRIVVLGGGLVGCETAVHLAQHGKDVTIVEMRGELAPDAYRLHKHQLRDLVNALTCVRLNTACTAVHPDGVEVKCEDGTIETIPADTIIAALGMKANDTAAIEDACTRARIPYHKIGDCVKARKIFDAVEEGFMTALAL